MTKGPPKYPKKHPRYSVAQCHAVAGRTGAAVQVSCPQDDVCSVSCIFLVGNHGLVIIWDLFKVFSYFVPWDSSPSNHHLGEYVLHVPSILSKSK